MSLLGVGLTALDLLALAAPALADAYPGGAADPPTVKGTQFFRDSGVSAAAQEHSRGGLAFTGTEILLLVTVALVLIALGAVLWTRAQARRHSA